MNVVRFCRNNRHAVYLLSTFLTIAGAAAVFQLPSNIYPELNFPRIVLLARSGEPAPPVSISRDEYDAALAALSGILAVTPGREEEAWRRFAWIRSAYDPALRALAGVTLAAPAPWTTDRPAEVGKPRFIRRRPLHVDWSSSAPPALTGG